MQRKQQVLVLAPHTDDGELGCGGSISKFIEEGKDVYYVAFSIATRSLPPHLAPDTLANEVRVATKVLGIPGENLILFDFDVRRFKEFRQDILEEIIKIKSKINPDLVFVPTLNDIHQDHQVIAEEGLRAFKNVSILGYELPWNSLSIISHFLINLHKSNL